MSTEDSIGERGIVLLEAILALSIVSIAGIALVALMLQASGSAERAQQSELTERSASRFLDWVSLWPKEDLDRHLGSRRDGPWVLEVARSTATTYRIVVRDSSGRRAILNTVVFRAEGDAP